MLILLRLLFFLLVEWNQLACYTVLIFTVCGNQSRFLILISGCRVSYRGDLRFKACFRQSHKHNTIAVSQERYLCLKREYRLSDLEVCTLEGHIHQPLSAQCIRKSVLLSAVIWVIESWLLGIYIYHSKWRWVVCSLFCEWSIVPATKGCNHIVGFLIDFTLPIPQWM